MARSDDDASLIEGFQRGEESALEELMRRHKEGLFRFILRYVNQREEAADLLSETFIKAYQKRQSYRPKAQFQTWLYTIARNLCVDHLRRRKVQPVPFEDAEIQDRADSDPAQDAVMAEEVARVNAAIDQLPEKLRSALILYALEGKPQLEVAEILGCSEKAVETRVRRAKEVLRKELKE